MSGFAVVFFLALGNFAYQWLTGSNDWMTASERSFFQAWAVITYIVLSRVTKEQP